MGKQVRIRHFGPRFALQGSEFRLKTAVVFNQLPICVAKLLLDDFSDGHAVAEEVSFEYCPQAWAGVESNPAVVSARVPQDCKRGDGGRKKGLRIFAWAYGGRRTTLSDVLEKR